MSSKVISLFGSSSLKNKKQFLFEIYLFNSYDKSVKLLNQHLYLSFCNVFFCIPLNSFTFFKLKPPLMEDNADQCLNHSGCLFLINTFVTSS